MFRRPLTLLPIRGRPSRKEKGPAVLHMSQRPPEPADIDFSSLGLRFPLTHKPAFVTPTGWTEPPAQAPDLPFFVQRSSSGSHGLPVYTDFKSQGRTKVITILKKCGGDIDALKSDLEKVCGREVQIKPGKLVVDGNYVRRVKMWLSGLGF